jgi:hypothetical protein
LLQIHDVGIGKGSSQDLGGSDSPFTDQARKAIDHSRGFAGSGNSKDKRGAMFMYEALVVTRENSISAQIAGQL